MSRKEYDDFDKYAKDYRQIHNECLKYSGADSDHFSEQKIEELRKNESCDAIKFLDLGCGDGNSAVFFRKHFPNSSYSGLDTSKASVGQAVDRGISGAEFSHYDGFNIPFQDSSFDVILLACVMHHIAPENHERFLDEVRRVLRLGGRLYIFEHNPYNPVTRRIVNNCPFDEDAVLLTSGLTRRLLDAARFGNVTVRYTIFFPRHRLFTAFLRFEGLLGWLPLGGQYYARAVKNAS